MTEPLHYLDGVSTLRLDRDLCIGCGTCETVCPRGVLAADGPKARVADRNGCIECGACALNCPTRALSVTPGVGCAFYIIQTWIRGPQQASCGPGCC